MSVSAPFAASRHLLRSTVAQCFRGARADLTVESHNGVVVGRSVKLRLHLLNGSLVPPAEVDGPPKLAVLNCLDRAFAFILAARARHERPGPFAWADAGLLWLAARVGLLPVPMNFGTPPDGKTLWRSTEPLLRHLLGRIREFHADGTVREIEAAHLGIVWSAVTAGLAVLPGGHQADFVRQRGPDRMRGVPAWTALRLARDPLDASASASPRRKLPKLEEIMNTIVAREWQAAGGAEAEWSIGKTVEKWDQSSDRGSCDPFSELLALCLRADDLTPLVSLAEWLGYSLVPWPSLDAALSTANGQTFQPCEITLASPVYALGAALGRSAAAAGQDVSVQAAWAEADRLVSRSIAVP